MVDLGTDPSPKNCAVTCASRCKSRRPLPDTERDMVADAIVEHIRLCNWKFERGPRGRDFRIWGRGSDGE